MSFKLLGMPPSFSISTINVLICTMSSGEHGPEVKKQLVVSHVPLTFGTCDQYQFDTEPVIRSDTEPVGGSLLGCHASYVLLPGPLPNLLLSPELLHAEFTS